MKEIAVKAATPYSKVYIDGDSFENNAYNRFVIKTTEGNQVCEINFQNGGYKEAGANGCSHADLINIVIARLKQFQNSEFKCEENDRIIDCLEKSILLDLQRTSDREIRGVEGYQKA